MIDRAHDLPINDIGATQLRLHRLDPQAWPRPGLPQGQPPEGPPIRHGNIRGRGYYH